MNKPTHTHVYDGSSLDPSCHECGEPMRDDTVNKETTPGWEENRAKNILFDFWRDYQNAPMTEDRDAVIEAHSKKLMRYFATATAEARQVGRDMAVGYINKHWFQSVPDHDKTAFETVLEFAARHSNGE